MITKERNNELRDLAQRRNEASAPNPEARALAVKINAGKATKQERKRFDALMELPGTGGGFVPAILNNEAEAERVRALQSELSNAVLASVNRTLESANTTLTGGHNLLSDAITGWIRRPALRTLKALNERLTDEEAKFLALIVTPTGTTKEGADKYSTQREIGKALGVSAMAVNRQENKFRLAHPQIAKWLDENLGMRKPRGIRKARVTKRKKAR
jgi:Trp operon repressor